MDKIKILAEYEALERNEFFKLYLSKLKEYSDGRVLALCDASLDKVARIQGELAATKLALSKPKELIETLTKEK